MLGTKRCNACWELERRLRDYLRKGGVNALRFIEAEVGAVMGFKVTVRKELP